MKLFAIPLEVSVVLMDATGCEVTEDKTVGEEEGEEMILSLCN